MTLAYRPQRALVLAVSVSLVVVLGTATAASAQPSYPSWGDVEAARGNAAATTAEIAKIEAFVNTLEAEAAAASKDALIKGEKYNQAADALAAATTRADTLSGQADAATEAAHTSSVRAGLLVSQLSRTGSGTGSIPLELFLSGSGADNLLGKLGTMSKLTEQSALVYAQAERDENSAKALTSQATIAKDKRSAIATDAQKVLGEAQAAAAAADAKVQSQKAASDQLYAQLASLKGIVASTEQGYQDGLAWEAAQNAVKTPPPAAAPVNPTPPAPSGNAVAGAIAFARAQLGEPYLFGGAGPNAWDCSGLTKMAYASVGVYIGTHSASNEYNTMANAGRLVPLAGMVAGDLLFYSTGGRTSGEKYHTTLYIGGGQMIEAPRPGVNVRIMPVRYGDLVPYAGRPTP